MNPLERRVACLYALCVALAAVGGCSSDDADGQRRGDTSSLADVYEPETDGAAQTDSDLEVAPDQDSSPDAAATPSVWLRLWECAGSVTATTESSSSEVQADFFMTVTAGELGRLSFAMDSMKMGPCVQTWLEAPDVAANTASLVDTVECGPDDGAYDYMTWSSGSATAAGDVLTMDLGGLMQPKQAPPDYVLDVAARLTCTACPMEACAGQCQGGLCCGGDGEPCCTESWCAGELACIDDGCTSDIPIPPCSGNFCQDNGFGEGFHCDGDAQRKCTTWDDGCFLVNAMYSETCEPGTCSPATGTCGGCDLSGECAGLPVGTMICGSGEGKECGLVDGCPAVVSTSTCATMCVFGSGCCGSAADPCCKGVTPSCGAALSCVDDRCQ